MGVKPPSKRVAERGVWGRSPPPKKGGLGAKPLSLADFWLCLDKVSKVRLG